MPISTSYLFIVSMDVAPEKEALFNEVYDREHIPYLSKVPGVVSVKRFKKAPLTVRDGAQRREVVFDDEPAYTAIYEIESPEVLLSDAWVEAGAKGRWASEVRPHTRNRRHILRRLIGSGG
jgi:hypothetical protein